MRASSGSSDVKGVRSFSPRIGHQRLKLHLAGLLSPGSRATVIRSSHWAIDPPTDDHPFFLQVGPRDVFSLGSQKFGIVSAITFNGVRVLLATVGLAAIAALIVSWWATRGAAARRERLPHLGRWYFALIGLGYMAVQLALLQRLSIVIGHPVTCLALVVASMLLGRIGKRACRP